MVQLEFELVNAAMLVRLTFRRHAAPEHEALRGVADRRHAPQAVTTPSGDRDRGAEHRQAVPKEVERRRHHRAAS